MAAATIVSKSRQDAQKKKREQQKQVDRIFSEFDVSKTGSLNKEELEQFLQFLNDGERVSEDEVKLVMHIADSADGQIDGGVSRKEFLVAADAWSAYKSNIEYIRSIFSKYDVSKSGTLDHQELKRFLSDLNDGNPPSDSEVDHVLEFADSKDGHTDRVVKPTTVLFAVSVWFAMLDEEKAHYSKMSKESRGQGTGCSIS